jgi:hypothetical protein
VGGGPPPGYTREAGRVPTLAPKPALDHMDTT